MQKAAYKTVFIFMFIVGISSLAFTQTIVGVAKGTDYTAVTSQAVSNAGGLAGIVKRGDTVLIKPNMCTYDYIDSPLTTDYRVTAEIVRQVKALGAGRIIIAEGPFDPDPFSVKNLEVSRYNTITGVEFLDFNTVSKNDCYYVTAQNSVTKKALYVPKIYVDADVVINIAKLKTHEGTVISLGLKNAIGVPPMSLYNRPRAKLALHNEFNLSEAIVELNLIRTPDFTVIDGIVGGERRNSRSANPVRANTIIAGRDIVAVDAVGAYIMGFNPRVVPHLVLAARSGLGTMDLSEITAVGGKMDDMVINFHSPFPKGW